MYNVSEQYRLAMSGPAQVRKLTGTIGGVDFDESNIISTSLIIDNKCSEGNQVKIGSVYIGQMSVVFTDISFPGDWFDQEITISEWLLVGRDENDEDVWEEVPLGVFHVVEANRAEDGMHVTAYDNMDRLDKDFTLASTIGTAYDLLYMISTDCGVQLAQTEEEIRALPNGTMGLVLYPENDISTYRDLLFWVAQTVGCFATMDRSGKLELRQYGVESVDDVGVRDRWRGSSFSEFVTKYTSISVVRIEKDDALVKRALIDDGLMYELGANPLLQNISLDNPLNELLGALARIQYTPFTVLRSGYPAYDLGDVVTFPGGIGKGAVGCVMSYQYTFHGEFRLEGYGSNPALMNAKSKEDKQIAALAKNNNISNTINYYTYTNASPIDIREDYKEIIRLRFGAQKDTVVVFHAEVKLNAEPTEETVQSVIGNIKYLFNNEEVDYHPRETWIEGTHLLHLLYYFPLEGSSLNNLSVRMNTDGFVHIDRMSIQASVSGQGLVATYQWDGYLEFEETVYHKDFCNEPGSVDAITDTPTVELVDVITLEFAEDMSPVEFSNEPENIEPIDATPYINKRRLKDLTWGEVKQYTWGEIKELFLW